MNFSLPNILQSRCVAILGFCFLKLVIKQKLLFYEIQIATVAKGHLEVSLQLERAVACFKYAGAYVNHKIFTKLAAVYLNMRRHVCIT